MGQELFFRQCGRGPEEIRVKDLTLSGFFIERGQTRQPHESRSCSGRAG